MPNIRDKIGVATSKAVISCIPCARALNAFVPRDNSALFCLAYHEVQPTTPSLLQGMDIVVQEEVFRSQIQFLMEHFNCIAIADIGRASVKKETNVLITFDDGFLGAFRYALPILKSYKCPAIVFLTTGFTQREVGHWRIGLQYALRTKGEQQIRYDLAQRNIRIPNDRSVMQWTKNNFKSEMHTIINQYVKDQYGDIFEDIFLSWDDIRQMRSQDISFGVHTHSHPVMSQLDYQAQENEIKHSLEVFQEKLGTQPVAYAHSFGRKCDSNQNTIVALKKFLPEVPIFSTCWGVNYATRNTSELYRIGVHNWSVRTLQAVLYYVHLKSKGKRIA